MVGEKRVGNRVEALDDANGMISDLAHWIRAADSDAASIASDMSFIFDLEHDVRRGPRMPIAGTNGSRRPKGREHQFRFEEV